ncbi:MAG: alpha/beta hydrolase, partial [Bacteroidota bacterium]
EIKLGTKDGENIDALYFTAPDSTLGVVLYLHGNADNLQRWAQYHPDFTERGYDFFAIDYRGYGKSTGKATEQGLYKDAERAYHWLRQRFPSQQIIIYGRSLGTGVASHLAQVAAAKMLVLETPYDNMQNLLLTRMPALPLPFQLRYQFPTDERLPLIDEPVYILQGTEDSVVPYRDAVRLKPLLKTGDRFITIEGGGHKNLSEFELFQQTLDELLGPRQSMISAE